MPERRGLEADVGRISRTHSQGQILETHFDCPPLHGRSSSYSSMAPALHDRQTAVNLNNSFPGYDSTPYISSSVTLPATSEQHGFYQNLSGRMREPGLRQKEEARNSFSRQADLHKSPRTQELEEFAAKFEGYQKQRTRRLATQPTPMLDQLARETNNQFWLANTEQLNSLETSLLRLVQRNDSISLSTSRARALFSEESSSGRESVSTVISSSSSETIKLSEKHSSSETLKWSEPEGGEAVRDVTNNNHQPLYRSQSEDWQDSSGHLLTNCSFCHGIHCRTSQERCEATFTPTEIPDTLPAEKNTFPRPRPRTRKPKLPTPPCSPLTGAKSSSLGRTWTPSPPPPPSHTDLLISSTDPLPPPPAETLPRPEVKGQGPGHSWQATLNTNKSPASTPKRESPATIAAKEAPGWEKFLGVKSQTVSFTSEEATKFRAARDESRSRVGHKKEDGRRTGHDERGRTGGRNNNNNVQRRDVLNNFFHKMEENKVSEGRRGERTPRSRREEVRSGRKGEVGSDENHNVAGPAPDTKHQSLHLSRERSLKSISNWWKNSLESGPSPPGGGEGWVEAGEQHSPRHHHSHSDSGISSMSGRSSCMSPMSELSSSSGSSRTSLRSSSIVSGSNILLEEEGETEVEYIDLCRELLMFAPAGSRIVGLIRASLTPVLQVHFPEGSLEFEVVSSKENSDGDTPKRSRSTNFEESRKNLLKHACMRIDTQRKHQQLLKESTKSNEEVGKEIISELKAVCHQQEIDKVKLFTEEVDKITSLIIGLSSRLAKVRLSQQQHADEKLQRLELERREKLEEQLDEARKLRQSIFRRGDVVFGILAKYLDPRSVEAFGGFIKEKIRLILENRQHTEILKNEEEILKSLKEYNSVTGVMII